MSSKLRIPLITLVCLVLLFSGACPIWAHHDEVAAASSNDGKISDGFIVSPMMMYISRTITGITIGTYGETTASGSVTGYQGITDEVWIYLYLERYINGSWQTFESWSRTFNNYYGYLQGNDVVPHGYYYRVKGSYYAFSGSDYEHVNGYSSTVYY
jgi:hypothetical protein